MAMININELNSKIKKKEIDKEKIFEEILIKCHKRIKKSANQHNAHYCFYVIPRYVYGVPLYNHKNCLLYIIKSLTKNGFDVRYTHPNLLFISWLNKQNPKNLKLKEQKKNEYRDINDYKPSGNIIYNKNILENLGKKINLLKN